MISKHWLYRPPFLTPDPFPHVVIDRFIVSDLVRHADQFFPRPDKKWTRYDRCAHRTFEYGKMADLHPDVSKIMEVMLEPETQSFIRDVTGFTDLLPGGPSLGETLNGGFLGIGRRAPLIEEGKWRRVSLILFSNAEWRKDWRGDLELWGGVTPKWQRSLTPTCNRAVIFIDGPGTWLGFPETLRCPPHTSLRYYNMSFYSSKSGPHDPKDIRARWLNEEMEG